MKEMKMSDLENLLVTLCHELDGIKFMIDTEPKLAKARIEKLVDSIVETINKF